ncbi:transporter substrate-binding domain-containing protein [Thermovenabulum sp.]|uniref:transporter substrate-binding domain-containing protein n=1 Tax=Thermovenabulum sp. TaxID=3100335 RepID=UPI003C7CE356
MFKPKIKVLNIYVILFIFLIAVLIWQILKITGGEYNNLSVEEMNYLKNKGKIIYGADINAPPLRYLDTEDGQYKGLVLDYLHALSLELGINIETKPFVWATALEKLSKGETDMCDMFESPERAKKYLFTKPIYNLRGTVAVLRNSNINDLKDIEGKKIALQKGDYTNEYFNQNYKDAKIFFVNDLREALNLLINKKVEVVAGDEPVLLYFINKMRLSDYIEILETPLYEKPVVFAVPKNKPELVSILNKGIEKINQKNVLEKIQQKWFGLSTTIIIRKDLNSRLKNFVLLLMLFFAIIVLFLGLLNYSLKKEVEIRTKEIEDGKNQLKTIIDGIEQMLFVVDEDLSIKEGNKKFKEYVLNNFFPHFNFNNIKLCDALSFLCKKNCDSCIFIKAINEPVKNHEIKVGDYIYLLNTYFLKENLDKKKILFIIDDITLRRLNEIQLLQANKMMAVGQLAAGVAHEIRNPLGIIRTYTYLLEQSGFNKEIFKKALEEINKAVQRADRIVNNLLNFSRISGENCEFVNLEKFIRDILEVLYTYIKRNNIIVEINNETKHDYLTNPDSLNHILTNIIKNAVDAMSDKGGTISIAIKDVDNGFKVYLKDTGKGIKKEHMEHIFNPFFTTKSPGKGTGLGLFITYTEIKKLNGSITIKSEENIGTEVEIFIPAKGREIRNGI